MVYQANVISVMIASPGDVEGEREVVRRTLHDLNDLHAASSRTVLLPVGWETHTTPHLAGRPQGIINEMILDKCDLLVGVFWTRLGTPTGEEASGTVEEIKRHIEVGKPAMIYFSSAPVAPETIDHAQWKALDSFKSWCMERGLVESYDSVPDFEKKFHRQLQIMIRESFRAPEVMSPDRSGAANPKSDEKHPAAKIHLRPEAVELLSEAARGDGQIMSLNVLGGKSIQANGIEFCGTWDRRKVAILEAAIKQLEENELIEVQGSRGEIFGLTALGFEVADNLGSSLAQ